jgi:transcriptional regulator with XRE-family HTH domain
MTTKDIINLLHSSVEAQNFGKRISHKEMAEILGISMRTYQEWRLGNSEPLAINAIFKMLGHLEDEDIVRVVKRIKQNQKG